MVNSPYIYGRHLIEELAKAGIIGPIETIQEVIVTANCSDVVRIRVEHVGTKNMIHPTIQTIIPKTKVVDHDKPSKLTDGFDDTPDFGV